MATKLVCTTCGFYGEPTYRTFGTSNSRMCPKCRGKAVVPPDSPVGKKMLADMGMSETQITEAVSKTQKSSKRKLYFKTFLVIFSIIAFSIFMDSVSNPSVPETPVPVVTKSVASLVFDVPSLLNKNIDGLKATLGKPDNDTEPTAIQREVGIDTWDKTWIKNGYSLTATYDVKTKKVTELFISPKSGTLDKSSLLKIGNLSESDTSYSIEFIKARSADGYTGVVVR